MASTGAWCLIESDPGVFTQLIHDFGVTGVQVEEICSLDNASLNELKPVYGLVFLFKWVEHHTEDTAEANKEYPNVFFAQQVIQNACATHAIINILMNCPQVDIGHDLTDFKTFVGDFSPDMKGLAISNSTKLREVHNSFAKPDTFLVDEDKHTGKEEEGFHFVAYVPVDGHIYELDGLRPGPVDLGPVDNDWLKVAVPSIEAKIQKYASNEIRFNLMAVIKDRKAALMAQLEELMAMNEEGPDAMDVDKEGIDLQISNVQERIRLEEQKAETYRLENVRRKHNYIPFFINALQILAKKGELMPLVQQAKGAAQGGDDKAKS